MFHRTSLTLPFSLSLLALGCNQITVSVNTDHCALNEGDRYCAELFPDRPFCIQGQGECSIGDRYGCLAEVPGECHEPCGLLSEEECFGSASSGTDTGSGSGSETQTDAESSSTGPMPCMGHEDCPDAEAPLCEPASGECVGCDAVEDGDAACAELDAAAPLCVGGACVECTDGDSSRCDEQLLVCDEGTNACAPCTQHAQCGAGACDISEGRCFDPDNVLHVGMGQTYATIGAALDDVGAMMLDPAVLVLHGGPSFDEVATIDAGVVAFVAFEDEQPQWVHTGMLTAPTLTVTGAETRVYLERVRLSQNGNDLGLSIDDGAQVDVRRSQIVANSGGGVLAQNNAELTLRNCFVGDGNTNNTDAITVTGATVDVLYTTVGAAANTGTATRALFCDGGGQAEVRNSILVSFDPGLDIECPGLTIANSATEVELGMLDGAWFSNYGTGDFHLTMMAPVALSTIGSWQTGDPTTDINGDLRPAIDGTPDYAGADIPPR